MQAIMPGSISLMGECDLAHQLLLLSIHSSTTHNTKESCESVDEHAMRGMVKAMAHRTGRNITNSAYNGTALKRAV